MAGQPCCMRRPVETLRERVFQVFGSQLLEDLIELQLAEPRFADAGAG